MEFGELLVRDALARQESYGGHFRAEYQTADGEVKRDDARPPTRHKEPLHFEEVQLHSPGGLNWWRERGTDAVNMRFDLAKDSPNRIIFDTYRRARAAKQGGHA